MDQPRRRFQVKEKEMANENENTVPVKYLNVGAPGSENIDTSGGIVVEMCPKCYALTPTELIQQHIDQPHAGEDQTPNWTPGQNVGQPDQGLPPTSPPQPDQGLPPTSPGAPDQGLPPDQSAPDQGLPPDQGAPDQGVPPSGAPPAVSGGTPPNVEHH
jgi:hypothetical protein